MVVILGAGLAGLSTALHLGADYMIFEREDAIGGLCRTRRAGRFLFDYTGHLLHLRNDHTRRLMAELLPDAFNQFERSAWIFSKSVYTPYPFQANTYGLPPEIVKECLLGYFEAWADRRMGEDFGQNESFEHWVLRIFGRGIARHFLFPYNEKLWQTSAAEMTADWVSWSVPRPEPEEVINGALGLPNKSFGYNPSFMYPKNGGIGVLPEALASRVSGIAMRKEAVRIDPVGKKVFFQDGSSEGYDSLVSTLPLPALFRIMEGVPEGLREAVARLRHTSVLDINLGAERERVSGRHWIYFPEPEIPFYRVGFPSNFSDSVVPFGSGSMYVEIAHLPENPINEVHALEKTLDGLVAAHILTKDDEIIATDIVDIPYAYVVYDRHRQMVLPEAMKYLDSLDIYSTGRYGAWVYGSMEDAILQGKDVANKIRDRTDRR